MQKKFCEIYAMNTGILSKTDCAIKAGYALGSCHQRAYELTNPKIMPHVVEFLKKIRVAIAVKYEITKDNHLTELWRLREDAKKKGMAGIALRAEELRGKIMGYYPQTKKEEPTPFVVDSIELIK